MATVTSEIRERVDALVVILHAFAERHGVETAPAGNLAEIVADAIATKNMTLDEVIETTRFEVMKAIIIRSGEFGNHEGSPTLQ